MACLVEVGDPIVYQYDAAGQVIAVTDRNGRQRTFTYNDLGAKTSETWLDQSNNPVRVVSWTYDDAGRMISASDPDSSYSFTYDLVGNVTGVDNLGTPNMPRVALNYTYDYAGNRTSLIDNLGGRIDYGYADHRLASMTWTANNTYVAQLDFAYDTVGRPTTVTRNGGANGPIVTAYQYDDGDRLTSITHTLDPQGTPTVLSQFTYAFDATNQITSYTGPEGTLNYSYDQTGQLIGVSGARTESYSFDENGNRTMAGYVTGDFNRLLSDGTYNYTYDLEGNMLTKTKISDGEKTTFTWDHRNRLTHILVTNAAEDIIKEAVYTYDVFDRRIGVWEDADGEGSGAATERWTVYDGANPYADFDANGSLTTQYLYGQAMDQLFARYSEQGGVDWYLGDYVGSVRQLVASDGTVLDDINYSSFGQILTESNPENGDRFKFTGREYDALFAQYYYRARPYLPDAGRFGKEDPLGLAAGDSNFYRYVANSPVKFTDPTGLSLVDYWQPGAFVEGLGEGVGNIWHGVVSIFNGEAGAALGDRAVALVEAGTGHGFSGTAGEWGSAFWHMTMQIIGVYSIAEALEGADIVTGQPLSGAERWSRGASGVAAYAGCAAGGVGAVRGVGALVRWARGRVPNWPLPLEGGGARIGGRWFTEHALERMAPNTPEVMAMLTMRALRRAEAAGLRPGTAEFAQWWRLNGPAPRGIPPSVVEAEIANPGTTGVRVITNAQGDVVTVIPN